MLTQVSLHPEPGVEGAGREGRAQVDAREVQERLHQALVSTEYTMVIVIKEKETELIFKNKCNFGQNVLKSPRREIVCFYAAMNIGLLLFS